MIMHKPPSEHDEWLEKNRDPEVMGSKNKKPSSDQENTYKSINNDGIKNWRDELRYGE